MKQRISLWLMLLILPFVLGTSCKEEVDLQSIRYEGRITALTGEEFFYNKYNIIRITQATSNKGVPVGKTIGFIDREFGKKMEVGNILYFRVESFHEDRSSGIEHAEYYLRPDYYGEIILEDD
ncbi:MAG: hypothetical protein ACFNVO_10215 [Prevotella sp.]